MRRAYIVTAMLAVLLLLGCGVSTIVSQKEITGTIVHKESPTYRRALVRVGEFAMPVHMPVHLTYAEYRDATTGSEIVVCLVGLERERVIRYELRRGCSYR